MRVPFVRNTLESLLRCGILRRTDSVVAVCAGEEEAALFTELGLTNVVLSNLTNQPAGTQPYEWRTENAECLTLPSSSFAFGFVCDGLHHCSAPHRALTELYRISTRGIVVFETRDSWLQRLAQRLGLSSVYELEAVVDNCGSRGGVNNTDIPNFIYRWTEAEFQKTLSAFSPIGAIRCQYFYGLSLPAHQARLHRSRWRRFGVWLSSAVMFGVFFALKRQGNLFAMIAYKPEIPRQLYPWLVVEGERIVFNREFAARRFRCPTVLL